MYYYYIFIILAEYVETEILLRVYVYKNKITMHQSSYSNVLYI